MDQSRSRPGFWLLHIGGPAFLLLSALVAGYIGGEVKRIVLDSHTSIQETVVGALLIGAALITAWIVARPARPLGRLERMWLLLFVGAVIFFAGEDLNWGQHYIGWEASDYFLEHNREKETNIHNMWPLLFNRLPRAIMNGWLVIACILVPLGWRHPVQLTRSFVPEVLWPDRRLVFAAVMVFVMKGLRNVSQMAFDSGNWLLALRHSELEELMMACCLFLYALMLRERLGRGAGAAAG